MKEILEQLAAATKELRAKIEELKALKGADADVDLVFPKEERLFLDKADQYATKYETYFKKKEEHDKKEAELHKGKTEAGGKTKMDGAFVPEDQRSELKKDKKEALKKGDYDAMYYKTKDVAANTDKLAKAYEKEGLSEADARARAEQEANAAYKTAKELKSMPTLEHVKNEDGSTETTLHAGGSSSTVKVDKDGNYKGFKQKNVVAKSDDGKDKLKSVVEISSKEMVLGVGSEHKHTTSNKNISGKTEADLGLVVREDELGVKGSVSHKWSFTLLPKLKVRVPIVPGMGFARVDFFAGIGIDANISVAMKPEFVHNVKKESNDLSFTTEAKAELVLSGELGVSMVVEPIIEVGIELYTQLAIAALVEVKGKIDDFKSFTLESVGKLKGAFSGGVNLFISPAPSIMTIYQALGGKPDTLKYKYNLGHLDLFKFETPLWKSSKKWGSVKEFDMEKDAGMEAAEKKANDRAKVIKAIIDALMAVAKFIDGIIKAIFNFIKAIGKAIAEFFKGVYDWFAKMFMSKEKRQAMEKQEANNKAYEAVVKKALEDIKAQPKLVDKLSKITKEKEREEELQRMVREDEAVKAAYIAIFKPGEIANGEQVLAQLNSDISEFALVPRGALFELGGKLPAELSIKSAAPLDIKNALRIDVYCNGKRVVTMPINDPIPAGSSKRLYQIQLPTAAALPGIDPTKAEWEIQAVLDLMGNLKDKESAPQSFQIRAPKPQPQPEGGQAKPQDGQPKTDTPAPSGKTALKVDLSLLGGNPRLQIDKTTPVKAKINLEVPQDSPLTDKEIALPNLKAELRIGATLLTSAPIKATLQRGAKTTADLSIELPKQLNLLTLAFPKDTKASALVAALKSNPVTLVISANGKPLHSQALQVQIAATAE